LADDRAQKDVSIVLCGVEVVELLNQLNDHIGVLWAVDMI
jgi:hypothetical protein